MPVVSGGHDRTPEVRVCTDDLAERGGEDRGVGVCLFDVINHDLEALNLGMEVLAARLGTGDTQTELEVLLVADEYVGDAGYLGKDIMQFALAAFPE